MTKPKFPSKTVAIVAAAVVAVKVAITVPSPTQQPTAISRTLAVAPPRTNRPPPSQTFGFTLSQPLEALAGVEAYVGHASGQYTTAFFIPSASLSNLAQPCFTLTNLDLRQPLVIVLQAVSTNGMAGAPSAELWWNFQTNGQVYSVAGKWYLGFVETNGASWSVSPAMPDGPTFYTDSPRGTVLAQVALPRPGYYRIGRQ